MLWFQSAKNIGLSNHKLKPHKRAPYDHNARPSKTDRRTNMFNSALIRSNERIARK